VSICPDAAVEKDERGSTPLHYACSDKVSLDVVAVLVKVWPDAVKEKNYSGWTPLHEACLNGSPLEVTALLLNTWLAYKENRSKDALMCFQPYISKYASDITRRKRDCKILLSHLLSFCNSNTDHASDNEAMNYFICTEMCFYGITLIS